MKNEIGSVRLLLFLVVMSFAAPLWASDKALIKSTVLGLDGKPVAGAYVFFYDSPDTKRAVDLVSPVTDKQGYCQKDVPPGSYWVLARLKKTGNFDMGPLMVEDKVSAEPREISVSAGEVLELEFTVMDLLDTVKTRSMKRTDLNRISGQIVNEEGEPINNAFIYANSHNTPVTMPEYFSAWTAEDGNVTLYLPAGKYYLGVATDFVPDQKYVAKVEININSDLESQKFVLKNSE